VADSEPDNKVSAYFACNVVSIPNNCPNPNYSLQAVKGSPYSISPGDAPGPMTVDAYGNFLYVLDTGSNQISGFRISAATGGLTPLTPPTIATNLNPTAIAIRSDDSWLFVSNLGAANISQYSMVVSTGNLETLPPIPTLDYPSGVAVH